MLITDNPADVAFWVGALFGFFGGNAVLLTLFYTWRQSRIRKMSNGGRRMHR